MVFSSTWLMRQERIKCKSNPKDDVATNNRKPKLTFSLT